MIIKTQSRQYGGYAAANDIGSNKNVLVSNNTNNPAWVHVVTHNFSLVASNATGGGIHIGRIAGAVTNNNTISIDNMSLGDVESLVNDVSVDGDRQFFLCGDIYYDDNVYLTSLTASNASAGTASFELNKNVTVADNAYMFIGPITGTFIGSIAVPRKNSIVIEKAYNDKIFTTTGKNPVSAATAGVFMSGVA
jgi:hypothetical protein|tara:strand:- start:720 stop:1298 length:579 start_codon:yes stop_codon:yes gene_type:complete